MNHKKLETLCYEDFRPHPNFGRPNGGALNGLRLPLPTSTDSAYPETDSATETSSAYPSSASAADSDDSPDSCIALDK
ncbi:hypothetical protein V6N11_030959 [Hibiscus sabdariffa]|uniref:Uncharacterized protein n=1 Tax=Hibiscus sabdariffa TaxID=183260 RepID=A0ABR2NRW8_9ROSI